MILNTGRKHTCHSLRWRLSQFPPQNICRERGLSVILSLPHGTLLQSNKQPQLMTETLLDRKFLINESKGLTGLQWAPTSYHLQWNNWSRMSNGAKSTEGKVDRSGSLAKLSTHRIFICLRKNRDFTREWCGKVYITTNLMMELSITNSKATRITQLLT